MCDFTHEFLKSRFKAQIVVALAAPVMFVSRLIQKSAKTWIIGLPEGEPNDTSVLK